MDIPPKNPSKLMSIAVLGGTGRQGKGLVLRWAQAGYRVFIGSRSPERARVISREIACLLDGHASIQGTTYQHAAECADIIVLTVPYSVHKEILERIRPFCRGKILVDVTVPLSPGNATQVWFPPTGSAAQEARQILGTDVEICTAFQNVSSENLSNNHEDSECDVLVTGTSEEARKETLSLVFAAGYKGWDAGSIENSSVVEGLTSVLIHINKKYKSSHAGLKITGVDIMR